MYRLIIVLIFAAFIITGCVITPDYSLYNNEVDNSWLIGTWENIVFEPTTNSTYNTFEFYEEDGKIRLSVGDLRVFDGNIATYEYYDYKVDLEEHRTIGNIAVNHKINISGEAITKDVQGNTIKVPVYITGFYAYLDKTHMLFEVHFHQLNPDKSKGPSVHYMLYELIRVDLEEVNL